jgi:hypothetical protein
MDENDPRRKQQEAHKHDFDLWSGDRHSAQILDSTTFRRTYQQVPVDLGRQVILDAMAEAGMLGNPDFVEPFARALMKRLNVPVK